MTLLTDMRARNIKPGDKPVAHGSIPGLRLEPSTTKGQGKWILRFVSPATNKRRDMGLGIYPEVGIANVHIKGMAARQLIADGIDPIEDRDAKKAARLASVEAMTFERAARQVHEDQKPGWKNAKHIDQWINTLRDYVFPKIGKRKVNELSPADFAEVLRPIWLTKPETSSRVKQRCQTVMKWCWAHGFVQGNPVDVVDHLLPQQPGKRERTQHQPAMPWRDIPAFVATVLHAGESNVSRSLLEFVVLTAARSGEARAMLWDEVDLEAHIWTVPASRMKAKAMHRVPLSDRAVNILETQRKRHPAADIVFPAPRGGVLSDMVLTKFLRDHKAKSSDPNRVATAHGFRSSFRDWASENGYPRDLAERALAHTIANQAEAAYHRTDLLEQRRAMMGAWAQHIGVGASSSRVVPLRRRASGQSTDRG
jgi:integrase